MIALPIAPKWDDIVCHRLAKDAAFTRFAMALVAAARLVEAPALCFAIMGCYFQTYHSNIDNASPISLNRSSHSQLH